jgi:hypothetical protein
MSEQQERRRFHRFPFDAECRLELASGQQVPCRLLDLSINGALVKVDNSDGDHLVNQGQLKLSLTGLVDGARVELEMMVTVVRVHDQRLACRYTLVDTDSFAALKSLVADNLGDIQLLDRELTQLDYWPGLSMSPAS